ncbi:hypothetical protein Tco_0436082 [Tanacetum coccineum]
MELQHIQLDERELHQKYLAWFEKLKTNLGFLRSSFNFLNTRPFEIAFRIFFREEHPSFREKMYHNMNQLQWQLDRDNFHGHVSKTCLVNFNDGMKWEPENFRSALIRVLEELDKLIDERALKYEELRIKESEVKAIKEIEKRLKESELQQQESSITERATIEACLATEGATLEACLVNEGITLNDNTGVTESNRIESTNNSSETLFRSSADENKSSDKESSSLERNDADVDIGSLNDSKYTTWDRNKEERDYVDYEQQHDFFASLINNLKFDVEKCNEVNREAQQANALLTNELERYKAKEKHFAKDMTIESEYCKKIKLLNEDVDRNNA